MLTPLFSPWKKKKQTFFNVVPDTRWNFGPSPSALFPVQSTFRVACTTECAAVEVVAWGGYINTSFISFPSRSLTHTAGVYASISSLFPHDLNQNPCRHKRTAIRLQRLRLCLLSRLKKLCKLAHAVSVCVHVLENRDDGERWKEIKVLCFLLLCWEVLENLMDYDYSCSKPHTHTRMHLFSHNCHNFFLCTYSLLVLFILSWMVLQKQFDSTNDSINNKQQ